ncbi:MAG: hypothetical protein DRP84_08955 [Spirochaetes bacterium]|nr:MAG: hypothetical protein DRP84_08955 [Spirochaetota bacterium]
MNSKILVLSPELGYGGIGINALKRIKFLLEKGFRVEVYTNNKSEGLTVFQHPNLKIKSIVKSFPGFDKFNPLFELISFLHLKTDKEQPKLVIKNLPPFYFHLYNSRIPELIVSECVLNDQISAISNLKGKEYSERLMCSRLGRILVRGERAMMKKADRIIAISHYTKDSIVNNYSIDKGKIEVIYNSIDPDFFNRKRYSEIDSGIGKKIKDFKGDNLLGVWVGRPHAIKNPELLFEIINDMRDYGVKFIIIGMRQDDRFIKDYTNGIEEDRVLFLGRVDNDLLPEVYSLSDFLLITSVYENIPTVLLEAMSCGCVPISTNVGGIAEVIDDGVNGFLINPHHDKNGFMDKIHDLLNSGENTLNKLRESAVLTIRERFSNDVIKEQYIGLIKEMIS